MSATRGDWMQTATGRALYPLDPRPEEITIEDIAKALSKLCRFGGHCDAFYSVAEHSIHMARSAQPEHKLAALLHDASEAYIADITRPAKAAMPDYARIEERMMLVIAAKFGFQWPLPPEVKHLDNAMLAAEKQQIMGKAPQAWLPLPEPLDVAIGCWSPAQAEKAFLKLFNDITEVKN